MIFVNCTDLTEIARTGKPGVNKFVIDDGVVSGEEAQLYLGQDGALHVGLPGTAPMAYRGYEPKEAQGVASLLPGITPDVFNYGEEDETGEPLIWILTQSIMVANGIKNEMSIVMLDDGYLLVSLRKGVIEVQSDEEGNTVRLSRGMKKNRNLDELSYASASSWEFLGLPKDDLRIMNSVFAFEITRKRSKFGIDFECRTIVEATGLLDLGVYQDIDEQEEARILQEQEEKEERERLRIAAEERARIAREEEVASDLAQTASSFGTRKEELVTAVDKNGRSLAAAAFLADIRGGVNVGA